MALQTKEVEKTGLAQMQDEGNRLCEFACGWGASFINICVTYPIHKVMFRQVRFDSLPERFPFNATSDFFPDVARRRDEAGDSDAPSRRHRISVSRNSAATRTKDDIAVAYVWRLRRNEEATDQVRTE